MTILSHKILLQPKPQQEKWLIEQCGYERWCYNQMLTSFKRGLSNGIWWDKFTLDKDLRHNKPEWANPRYANGLTVARDNLSSAIRAWLNDKQKSNRFPTFKSKKDKIACHFEVNASVKVKHRSIKLPKLGWVRMRNPLRFDGKLVGNASISYDGRRWWISLTVDTQTEPQIKEGDNVIGVDVGIKSMAFTSDGVSYENPTPLKENLLQLRKIDKSISRSKNTHGHNKHSNRRDKLYTIRPHSPHTYSRSESMRFCFIAPHPEQVLELGKNISASINLTPRFLHCQASS